MRKNKNSLGAGNNMPVNDEDDANDNAKNDGETDNNGVNLNQSAQIYISRHFHLFFYQFILEIQFSPIQPGRICKMLKDFLHKSN